MGNQSKATTRRQIMKRNLHALKGLKEYIGAGLEKLRKIRWVPPPPPPAGFLLLPLEIRQQIYRYCIPRNQIVVVAHPYFNIGSMFIGSSDLPSPEDDIESSSENKNSVFLVCKQISDEALDVLYGDNLFRIRLNEKGESSLKDNFTEANRQRMRSLLLIAEPRGVSYGLGKIPDYVLWSSIIPTLNNLRIIAKQPTEAGSYGAPTLEEDVDEWLKWMKPFLKCFGQHLSRGDIVEVDVDGQAETMQLVKECLPPGYREKQCRLVGDYIFRRGRFSWDNFL